MTTFGPTDSVTTRDVEHVPWPLVALYDWRNQFPFIKLERFERGLLTHIHIHTLSPGRLHIINRSF